MTRRRKLFTIMVIIAAMAITLASILRETDRKTEYGMTSIHLKDRTVYVKARSCGTACRGELWLSLDSHRCHPPDPARDYRAQYDTVFYAISGETLTLLGGPFTVTEPTGNKWLHLNFVPRTSRGPDAPGLRYIMFGHHLPERNLPGENVDLGPCVRAFGHTW